MYLSEVCAFLGTIGVCCIFIPNFAKQANTLVNLTHKKVPFEFVPTQVAAQADLREALLNSLVLQLINYNSDSLVILAIDISKNTGCCHRFLNFFLVWQREIATSLTI
jgi:hypothetical protein